MNSKIIRAVYLASGLFLGAIWLIFTYFACSNYPGNNIYFICFSLAFLIMLTYGWYKLTSYFYIFFSTFLMLGFWFKACVNLMTHKALVEPVGNFNFTGIAWDHALAISTIGAISLLTAHLVYSNLFQNKTNNLAVIQSIQSPVWYKKNNLLTWVATIAVIAVAVTLNFHYAINQVGVIPLDAHLPLHLNAIISILLDAGFTFWVATLIWWDFNRGIKLWSRVALLLLVSVAISCSMLSRGNVLFQTAYFLPPILFLVLQGKIKRSELLFFGLMLLVCVGINFKFVMTQRDFSFPSYSHSQNVTNNQRAVSSSGTGNIFLKLSTGRWIGLEGVMAVSSWPDLGGQTFYKAWEERIVYKQNPFYSTVANTIYNRADYPGRDRFYFASLPGVMAMLYYSGSLIVVFVGIFILSFLIFSSESIFTRLLANPFVMSYYGLYLAVLFSELNNVYVTLIQLLEIWLGMMIIYFLQIKADSLFKTSVKEINSNTCFEQR